MPSVDDDVELELLDDDWLDVDDLPTVEDDDEDCDDSVVLDVDFPIVDDDRLVLDVDLPSVELEDEDDVDDELDEDCDDVVDLPMVELDDEDD